MFQRSQQTPKFLTTTGVSYELERIINGAEDQLILVSPYLSVNQRIQELLADKARMNLDIRVVYGKSELSPTQRDWLSSIPSIRTGYCADLHAKCYLNEKSALITSMNLYEFSQVNNIEMGIFVARDANESLYEDIRQEVLRILRSSEERRPGSSTGTTTSAAKRRSPGQAGRNRSRGRRPSGRGSSRSGKASSSPRRPSKPESGFCIRCRVKLPADPLKPYCNACYKVWSRYKDKSYKDRYCHLCGGDHVTTFSRPVCKPCYSKNSALFASSSDNKPCKT